MNVQKANRLNANAAAGAWRVLHSFLYHPVTSGADIEFLYFHTGLTLISRLEPCHKKQQGHFIKAANTQHAVTSLHCLPWQRAPRCTSKEVVCI